MKGKQHRRKMPGKKKRSPDSTLPFPSCELLMRVSDPKFKPVL
jgi:hypothetical protein